MENMKKTYDYSFMLKCFGSFIKQQRQSRGEKIAAVGSSVGVTHPVISKIENGTYTSLSFTLFARLLDYYNIPLMTMMQHITEQLSNNFPLGDDDKNTMMQSLQIDMEKIHAKIQRINNNGTDSY